MSTPTPVLSPPAAPVLPPAGSPVAFVINGEVRIPANLTDLEAFRRWAREERPEKGGRVSWINGIVWVETSMEQMYSHNLVKTEVARVLSTLVRVARRGSYLSDGMLISNPGVPLSTIPDGLFVSYDSLQSGRVRRVPSVRTMGAVELEGSLDMVLEVVSPSSVEKDFTTLPGAYHLANVQEFWRVDARMELLFEIFRWSASGYVTTLQPDGWYRSDTFAHDFRLTQELDLLDAPFYTLQVRDWSSGPASPSRPEAGGR